MSEDGNSEGQWASLTCPQCETISSYLIGRTTPCASACGWEVAARSQFVDEAAWNEIPAAAPSGEGDDFPPYTYGERRRNPYYTAQRDIWRYKNGVGVELMISRHADVTDIIQAYDVDPQLAEAVAKILRLGRKPGTNRRQEYTKMHEHIQAAEDAWTACRVSKLLED